MKPGRFTYIYVPSQMGQAKPASDMILNACQQLGIKAEDLLHIGGNLKEDKPVCEAAACQFLACERGTGIDLDRLRSFIS